MSRRSRPTGNMFGDVDEAISPNEVDAALFGEIAQVDAARLTAEPVSIFQIHPDPAQPRRTVPSAIRSQWDGTPEGISAMLELWLEAVAEERGEPFPLEECLNLTEDFERAEKMGPLEALFAELVDLASSCLHQGLTNPITVARAGVTYRLETGERRLLAFHLLCWYTQDSKWSKIPARVVDRVDVWRQAAENGSRADLNAIGRARQFALLLMDLYGVEKFEAYNPQAPDVGFYAQVRELDVPRGKGDQLLSVLGLKHRNAFMRCRKLLGLPPEVWQMGDDASFSEDLLLELSRMPADQAIAYAQRIVTTRDTKAAALAGNELTDDDDEMLQQIAAHAPGTTRHFADTARAVTRAGLGKDKFNRIALERLHELRAWVDEQEDRISHYFNP